MYTGALHHLSFFIARTKGLHAFEYWCTCTPTDITYCKHVSWGGGVLRGDQVARNVAAGSTFRHPFKGHSNSVWVHAELYLQCKALCVQHAFFSCRTAAPGDPNPQPHAHTHTTPIHIQTFTHTWIHLKMSVYLINNKSL